MSLTITFKLGTNLDQAQVLVQNRVAIATPRLPEDVRRLGITTHQELARPDDGRAHVCRRTTATTSSMSRTTPATGRDALLRLDGVGDLIIFGEREYSLRVWLDPERLSAYRHDRRRRGRGPARAERAGVGRCARDPAGARRQRLPARRHHPGPLREMPPSLPPSSSRPGREGRLIRLQDVARVDLGGARLRHQFLSQRQAGGGAGDLSAARHQRARRRGRVIAQDGRAEEGFPAGLDYQIVYNPTVFVAESMKEVYKTLFEAVALVVLVVIVFLQSWRTALIPILAIPVSLIGTFAVMAALGFSLNTLSLFGLVLAIGIVVDDAIVVVENVERNIALGLTPREAAHSTMNEVSDGDHRHLAGAVRGVRADRLHPRHLRPVLPQFALTIAVSTLISAFNSLTLSPALAATC